MLKNNPTILFITLITLFAVSCVPVSRISYVQSDTQAVFHGEPADIRIRPGDELYVRIGSADEQPLNLAGDGGRVGSDARMLTYVVNEQGEIKLPMVGRIKVEGYTLEDASDMIEEALNEFLYMPSVFLRFMNAKVTILGEVGRPGSYMFDYKNINILQAIGYAGDIGQFGNRKKVLIIREEGGVRQKQYIDLTRGSALESEWYNLKSGDVVFIEPLGRKKWGMAAVPYNLILTFITTSLFIYNFVQNQ